MISNWQMTIEQTPYFTFFSKDLVLKEGDMNNRNIQKRKKNAG